MRVTAEVVNEIKCSNCGAPLDFKPGEIVVTCRYCGYTVVISTGEPFTLEHSLLLDKIGEGEVEDAVKSWMRSGFLMPNGLARRAKFTAKTLHYLPFYIVPLASSSHYKGIFERISPPIVKEGTIEKSYEWLVLGRKASDFPTREYDIPAEGRVPFDFRKITGSAQVLNSEITELEAIEQAKQEVEAHHKFLASQEIDKIVEFATTHEVGDAVMIHAPIWRLNYEYKGQNYAVLLDGVTSNVITGDVPQKGFSLL